jgi:HAD superfamily hydrolase (TIGR01509 family)
VEADRVRQHVPPIRAIVFDFDGLIVDTETPVFQTWREICNEYGCDLTLENWSAALGTFNGFDVLAHLERETQSTIDRVAVTERKNRRERELAGAQPPLPGVVEYIAEAQRLGLKLAVASSSSRNWVSGHLTRLELIDAFDCLFCRDDVEHVKPEPQLYLAALSALGVEPEEAIAFEDSPNGITAARRAGMFCVAVPNVLTAGMPIQHADLILESLESMPLSDLLREIETLRSSRLVRAATPASRPGPSRAPGQEPE